MSPFGSFCNSHCTHVQVARTFLAVSLTCHFLLVILAADVPRSDIRRRFSTEGTPETHGNRASCYYPIGFILPHSLRKSRATIVVAGENAIRGDCWSDSHPEHELDKCRARHRKAAPRTSFIAAGDGARLSGASRVIDSFFGLLSAKGEEAEGFRSLFT